MPSHAHTAYLESRVLAADPVELVHILYQAALAAVTDARRRLAEGDIAARSQAITRAVAVLTELACSLDHERGGAVSRGLAELYDYLQRRLLEANYEQADAPLAEVLGLLATLSEGWHGVSGAALKPPSANTWPAVAPEAAAAGAQPPTFSLAG